MIVVGDASVFIALERIGARDLLPALFGEVHIPEAVWREIDPGHAATVPDWLIRHPLPAQPLAETWPERLDPGETAAILLAQSLQADLLLIDEITGRTVAIRLGLEVIGVVGLLLQAKRRQKIALVKPPLEGLRQSGFWISDRLFAEILRRAGE